MSQDDTGFDKAPDRYMATGKEAIDIIREKLGESGFVSYCYGCALKYELRAGHKAGVSEATDREKARWYTMMAAHVEGQGPDPRSYR